MSHEIRTPMNSIVGYAEMALRTNDQTIIHGYIRNIKESSHTLLHLINEILDISKIETGKMETVKVNYRFGKLIDELRSMMEAQAGKAELAFMVQVDDEIPEYLYGDRVKVQEIMTNLINNGLKYTKEGSVTLRVRLKDIEENRVLLNIEVEDTGIGIKEEDYPKVFAKFERLDETKNYTIEGSGLGLSIVKSFADMMGGDVSFESEYGKGTKFIVNIWQEMGYDEKSTKFGECVEEPDELEINSGRILIVDDNELNCDVASGIMELLGMQTKTAMSGYECLQLLKNDEQYEMIFMDHMMPEMDGIETFHRLKNNTAPVIALTANAVAGAKEFYLNEGFNDFLTKPIDGELLENMIASYLPKELIQQSEDAHKDNQVPDITKDDKKYQKYGISIEHGISYSNGDMEVYLDLISMFLNEDSMRDQLYQYMSEENLKEYAVLVHSLKGNARTLGADKLADIAYEHEMKSKAQDLDFVKSGWNELVDLWDTSLEGFQELYHHYRGDQEDKYRLVSAKDSDILELKESDLSEVVALIDDFETDKAVEQLKKWINSPLKPDVHEKIKNALIALEDEFDEDKAMLLLSK